MDPFADIDLDAAAVWLDGAWYTREALARRIKEMIEAGDFRVSRPSQALERLEAALAASRVVAVRMPAALAASVDATAARLERPTGHLIREAIAYYLAAAEAYVAQAEAYAAQGDAYTVQGDAYAAQRGAYTVQGDAYAAQRDAYAAPADATAEPAPVADADANATAEPAPDADADANATAEPAPDASVADDADANATAVAGPPPALSSSPPAQRGERPGEGGTVSPMTPGSPAPVGETGEGERSS